MSLQWEVPCKFLYPPFGYDLATVLDAAPFLFAVRDGYRTRQAQEERWAAFQHLDGPATAVPGRSPHEYGCAVHLVPLDGHGRADWSIEHRGWEWLAAHLFPTHPTLVHGRSRWRWAHIEWRTWKEVMWGHLKRR